MNAFRKRPSPAMVVALVALFVALGGSSYAAIKIGSGQIKNNSLKGVDVKNNSLTTKDVKGLRGADINESSLGVVPNAAQAGNAATVGGLSAAQLQLPVAYGYVEEDSGAVFVRAGTGKNVNSVRRASEGVFCIDLAITPRVALANAQAGDFRYANADANPDTDCNNPGEDIVVHIRFTSNDDPQDSPFTFVAIGG